MKGYICMCLAATTCCENVYVCLSVYMVCVLLQQHDVSMYMYVWVYIYMYLAATTCGEYV